MNNKTNKLIPKLRFPEFINKGEWQEKKLGDFGRFFRGLTYGADDTSSNGLLVLRSGNIQNETLVLDKDLVFVSKECPNELKLLKGDIVICMSNGSKALVGKNAEYKGEYDGKITVGAFCSIMRPKNKFTKYFLQSDAYQNFIALSIGGGNINNLKNSDLEEFECYAPVSPVEQQKIADCLSSLDEVIAVHTEKLETLKTYKKGLIQNLFPQDGEKIPKIRFKEFNNDGDWIEKNLIDTTSKKVKWSFTGGPFGSNLKASDYTSNGFRIIQLQNIGDSEFNDTYKIYTSEEKANELLSCNIYAGEIIISKMGDPVGRACIIPDNLARCVMASDGIRVVVDEEKYSKYFIYSLINSRRIREAIEKKATGSTRKRIGLDELKEIKLLIPSEIKEQQKIANTISSLDDLIKKQNNKIEELKLHKKGLMQGLFPKVKI